MSTIINSPLLPYTEVVSGLDCALDPEELVSLANKLGYSDDELSELINDAKEVMRTSRRRLYDASFGQEGHMVIRAFVKIRFKDGSTDTSLIYINSGDFPHDPSGSNLENLTEDNVQKAAEAHVSVSQAWESYPEEVTVVHLPDGLNWREYQVGGDRHGCATAAAKWITRRYLKTNYLPTYHAQVLEEELAEAFWNTPEALVRLIKRGVVNWDALEFVYNL